MTREQLEAVRAEKWRQKANPVLTQEDAEAWIAANGISLFIPRHAQLQAPAPSFVEAVLGEPNATPLPAAIQAASDLAQRLFSAETATPLSLLGAVSEQPDFLASPEALPYIFALRGDRDWKRGPGAKTSPLVAETWKALKREGVLTTSELQSQLGREVTQGAVLRALTELWTTMRVLPVYVSGEATSWELFESRQQKAMQAGAGMAQAMALSALVSLYLDSVVAATSDEIEAFLSPLIPRSRIREAVRGLEATRQLSSQQLGMHPVFYITGALPELPEIAAPVEEASSERPAFSPPPFAARPIGSRKPFGKRESSEGSAGERPRKPFRRDDGQRPERRTFGSRPAFGKRAAASGPRKEWTPRKDAGEERSSGEWKPREQQGEFRPRRAEGGEGSFKKPFRRDDGPRPERRTTGTRPAFGKRPAAGGPRKEWAPRKDFGQAGDTRPRRTEGSEGGFKKPFRKREDAPGSRPRREGSFAPRRAEGGFKKPFRDSGDKPSFKKPFSAGDRGQRPPRKEWTPRREAGTEGRSEFRPRRTEGGSKPYGARAGKPAGTFQPRDRDQARPPRREWKDRPTPGGDASSTASRPPRKEWKPRPEGSEARPSRPRREEGSGPRRDFKPRSAPGDFAPRRKSFGDSKPFGKPSFEKRERPAGEGTGERRREFKPRSADSRSGGSERPRRGPGDFAPRRKSFGDNKPFVKRERPAGEGTGERRPPRAGASSRPGTGRPSSGRPAKSFSKGGKFGSKPGKFGTKKSSFGSKSGPKTGGKRPGGSKPPFGKRKKKSEE